MIWLPPDLLTSEASHELKERCRSSAKDRTARNGSRATAPPSAWSPAAKLEDATASAERLRIYNDFFIDFCRHHPQRMIGLACSPFGDIAAAVYGLMN